MIYIINEQRPQRDMLQMWLDNMNLIGGGDYKFLGIEAGDLSSKLDSTQAYVDLINEIQNDGSGNLLLLGTIYAKDNSNGTPVYGNQIRESMPGLRIIRFAGEKRMLNTEFMPPNMKQNYLDNWGWMNGEIALDEAMRKEDFHQALLALEENVFVPLIQEFLPGNESEDIGMESIK